MSMRNSDKDILPKENPRSRQVRERGNGRFRGARNFLCFSGPGFVGVAAFFILPFFAVVYASFLKAPNDPVFTGLDNYIAVVRNTAFRTAAKNTALFSGIAVPLAVVLGLGLALLLECRIPCKSMLRAFFLSPMMAPVASVVLVWQAVFHYRGVLNAFLTNFGITPVDWLNSAYCLPVIVVLFLWRNLGLHMVLFTAALNNIPREQLEAADVDGASALRKFFSIKLRYLSSTVLFVTVLSVISSFKVFREIYLLAGAYPHEGLYMLQHFMNNTFLNFDYRKMTAAAVIMALGSVSFAALWYKAEAAYGKDVEE